MTGTGTVFWITGLAGTGKSTIGQLLLRRLRQQRDNVVFLDGDDLRRIFDNVDDLSREDRLVAARRISRLCKYLSDQGLHVVCATISLFREIQDWNRAHIERYREIYLRVPWEVLIARDQKQLYRPALHGDPKPVMGMDIPIEEPVCPTLVITNDGQQQPEEVVDRICAAIDW